MQMNWKSLIAGGWVWIFALTLWGCHARHPQPPSIRIVGVVDRAVYPRGTKIMPTITISSPVDPAPRYEITLNRKPYTIGTPITEPDAYVIVVKAWDKFGNRAMKAVSFVISDASQANYRVRLLRLSLTRCSNGNLRAEGLVLLQSRQIPFEKSTFFITLYVGETEGLENKFQLIKRAWLVDQDGDHHAEGLLVSLVHDCDTPYQTDKMETIRHAAILILYSQKINISENDNYEEYMRKAEIFDKRAVSIFYKVPQEELRRAKGASVRLQQYRLKPVKVVTSYANVN